MKNNTKRIDNSKLKIKDSIIEKKDQNLKTDKKLTMIDFFEFHYLKNQHMQKYFQNLENYIPLYYQTFAEFHLEYVQLCKNIFSSSNFLQGTTKNLNLNRFDFIDKITSDIIDSGIKSCQNRDEMILSSVESFRDIIKDWNAMFLSYTDVFKKFTSK